MKTLFRREESIMIVTTSVDVQNCEQCPYHKADRVWTADSFEMVRKVYCLKLKRDVHSYLDWHEIATIPKDYPYQKYE